MSARPPRRRGVILVLVLVVTIALCMAALAFSRWMMTEREAVDASGRQAQARALAQSGIESVRTLLALDAAGQSDAGGWYSNSNRFCGVLVVDDDQRRHRGRFSVVAPMHDDDDGNDLRFGLEDESAKLNVNTLLATEAMQKGAGRKALLALPNMTEDIADAILDWIDSDDETRESGAESDAYSSLDPPYAPANRPLETLDQLLLVRGVTPELLYGVDTNRNGYADDSEPDPTGLSSDGSGDSSMACGWSRYLTLYSCEVNRRSDGTARINVNMDDLKKLQELLEPAVGSDWATYIIAYRQQQSGGSSSKKEDSSGGNSSNTANASPTKTDEKKTDEKSKNNSGGQQKQVAETKASGKLDLSQPAKTRIQSLLDLIGQQVQVKYQGRTNQALLASPFSNDPNEMRDYLPKLLEAVTTDEAPVVAGRININLAPRPVLAGIPGMPEEALDKILSERQKDPQSADASRCYPTWLLTEGILTLEQMKQVFPFINAGGAVFRAQAVGFYDVEGPAARIEAVFDATQAPVRIVFWRDLTPLGRGYPLDLLGAQP